MRICFASGGERWLSRASKTVPAVLVSDLVNFTVLSVDQHTRETTASGLAMHDNLAVVNPKLLSIRAQPLQTRPAVGHRSGVWMLGRKPIAHSEDWNASLLGLPRDRLLEYVDTAQNHTAPVDVIYRLRTWWRAILAELGNVQAGSICSCKGVVRALDGWNIRESVDHCTQHRFHRCAS